MDLKTYLEQVQGTGVLATSDSQGRVNAAVYARPHFIDEETVAFIMPGRLTHHNLQSNPHAVYLFMEESSKTRGRRLYLSKTKEERDTDLLKSLRRTPRGDDSEPRFLVFFKIDKVLQLIGPDEV